MHGKYFIILFCCASLIVNMQANLLDSDFLMWHPYIYNYPDFPQYFGCRVEVDELASLDIHKLMMAYTGSVMERAIIGGAVTQGGEFYIFTLNFDYPTGEGPAIVSVRDIEKIDIDVTGSLRITPDNPFCFFCCSESDIVHWFLVIANNKNTLSFYKINHAIKDAGNNLFTLEFLFDYELLDSHHILRIIPEMLYNPADTTTLWVLGKLGCLYSITFKPNLIQKVKLFTIGPHDILCYGDGYVGTSEAYIFKYDSISNKFKCVAQQGESAIRNITKDWAVGDSGTFILNSGEVWKLYNYGSEGYQYAYPFDNHLGYGAILIDTAYRYVNFVYQNTPTRISGVIPDSLVKYINGECIHFDGRKEMSLDLVTGDPEHNYSVPFFNIHHRDSLETIILKDLHPGKYPGAPYSNIKRIRLNSNSFLIKKDTVIYSVEAQEYYHAGLNWFHWIDFLYKYSIPCVNGDTVSICIGEDSVRILFDYSSAVSCASSCMPLTKITVSLRNNNKIILNRNNSLNKIFLYTVAGELVGEYAIKDRKIITLYNTLSSGLYLLRGYNDHYFVDLPVISVK